MQPAQCLCLLLHCTWLHVVVALQAPPVLDAHKSAVTTGAEIVVVELSSLPCSVIPCCGLCDLMA
jgi:hypothetical protein